jgi:hypothetical protein
MEGKLRARAESRQSASSQELLHEHDMLLALCNGGNDCGKKRSVPSKDGEREEEEELVGAGRRDGRVGVEWLEL